LGSEESDIVLIFLSSALIAVALAGILVAFVVSYQKRMARQNLKLQQLENEKQQDRLRATIEGQERERERLASELHDGIGSLLLGLKFHLANQQRSSEVSPEQKAFLIEACEQLEKGMVSVRRLSHDLLPATLQSFGLIEAIKECLEPLQNAGVLQLRFECSETLGRFPSEVELAMLRVIQELIQNTVKHSQATEAVLKLNLEDRQLLLDYSDNGIGWSKNDAKPGLGLKNIDSRVQALNGTFEVDTTTNGYSAKITLNTEAWK